MSLDFNDSELVKPLGLNDSALAKGVEAKLCPTRPTEREVRQLILSGKRGRAALSKALRPYKHVIIGEDHMELCLEETDCDRLTLSPMEFGVLLRYKLVHITKVTLIGARPALKGLTLTGIEIISFRECKSQKGNVVRLINANADTLLGLNRPPLGVLLNVQPLALKVLMMDVRGLRAPSATQMRALLRHSVQDFLFDQQHDGSCEETLTPYVFYWLPAVNVVLRSHLGNHYRISEAEQQNTAVKRVVMIGPMFEGGIGSKALPELLRCYSQAFPNLELLIIACRTLRHRHLSGDPDPRRYLQRQFDVLQKMESVLESSAFAFRTVLDVQTQYVLYQKRPDFLSDVVPAGLECVDQSADLEKTGYGQQAYQRHRVMGPRAEFFAKVEFDFAEDTSTYLLFES